MPELKNPKRSKGEAARRKQAAYDAIRDYVRARADSFKRVLPERTLTVDRFVSTVLYNCYRTPDLLWCTHFSLFVAAMGAAKLGLEPDSVLGHAYLVPFEKGLGGGRSEFRAQLIIGYRGMAMLAYRDAKVVVRANVMRADDFFEFEDGREQVLRHIPEREPKDLESRVGAWAAFEFPDGRTVARVCYPWEIEAARRANRGSNLPSSPWKTHPDAMWMKTPVRRGWSLLPISPELGRAVEHVEAGMPIDEVFDDENPPPEDYFDGEGGPPPPDAAAEAAEKMRSDQAGKEPKTLDAPPEKITLSDVLGGEKVPAGGEAKKEPARRRRGKAASDAQVARFASFLKVVPAASWDAVFKAAGVPAPAAIEQKWLEDQDGETLDALSEAASKVVTG